jgi:hypothetical protein
MARRYNPVTPFDVAMKLLVPTSTMVKGVRKDIYPDPEEVTEVFFGSFRTYGGTENMSNDIYTVYDTAVIDTWYNPAITSDCKVYICETGETYDVISRPENIGMRHQYLQFKLRKVGGKP